MQARVDRDVCVGAAECVAIAPEVFELGDDGIAQVVHPEEATEEILRKAAEECPVQAISLADDDGNPVYP
jgi:ferredoxin